jgi:hypothetical protein
MMQERYMASSRLRWRHPADEVPPLGTKLLILTDGGVCVIGLWDPQTGARAWCPLPRLSKEMKKRLSEEKPVSSRKEQ